MINNIMQLVRINDETERMALAMMFGYASYKIERLSDEKNEC